jgi:hypothetical protein
MQASLPSDSSEESEIGSHRYLNGAYTFIFESAFKEFYTE